MKTKQQKYKKNGIARRRKKKGTTHLLGYSAAVGVVFYDFRLNGNWGVRSMFPHIHVSTAKTGRYQVHIIQGRR
jgi:hypothetical protein